MIKKGQEEMKGNRIYFLDNLRTFMIFLVVLYHSGLVYESSGIALTILNIEIPTLLKYFILTVSTYVTSNLIITFYRKVIKPKILIKKNVM